jgi:hypothetical protein
VQKEKERNKKKKTRKRIVWKKNGPYVALEKPVRLRSPSAAEQLRLGYCGIAAATAAAACALFLSLALAATSRRVGYRLSCRRPTPGAQVFIGLFASSELPPGMPAAWLPSLLLCETEHPNHNLSYLSICNRIWSTCIVPTNFEFVLQKKLSGVHVSCTPMSSTGWLGPLLVVRPTLGHLCVLFIKQPISQ